MSASNWAECPQCAVNDEAKVDSMRAELAAQYGSIPAGEYLNQVRVVDAMAVALEKPATTLREDWELGIQGGVFSVTYRTCCSRCDFEKHFTHREELVLKVTKPKAVVAARGGKR